jgi:dihydroxyacetone kinase-like protein
MRFSKENIGKYELSGEEFLEGLAAGVAGIQHRGSAQLGEKTMLDALIPATGALRQALAAGEELASGLLAAASAAQAGAEATTAMQANKGRASYLGPRSIGHQDPGATSAALLIKMAAEVVQPVPSIA